MTTATRILHVLEVYRPEFSGEGVYLERICETLRRSVPSLRNDLLVTTTPGPAEVTSDSLDRVFYLSPKRLGVWRRELALCWWLIMHVRGYRTVHVRRHASRYFLAYLVAKAMGRTLVLSATLDDSVEAIVASYRPAARPLARRALAMFDAFVSISRKLHEETSRCVAPEKCHLIENGIPVPTEVPGTATRVRRQLGLPADALVLVSVGGLCRRKDQRLLVECHADILAAHPECRLVLVGPTLEADYVAGLRAAVDRLGLGERVVFVGEVADAGPYYAAADVMVFASRSEGFGMVVPEAMLHGLPVVVRRLPGVNDAFVEPEVTGFFFDDPAGYTREVLRLAAEPELRRTIGTRARRFVRARYDIATVAERYLALYGIDRRGEELRADGRSPRDPARALAARRD